MALYISQNKDINISNILNSINNLYNKIKFTLEEESNKKLNYLELTLNRNDNIFDYSIYRKLSQTDLIIPNKSNHPPQNKMAAFNSLIYLSLIHI